MTYRPMPPKRTDEQIRHLAEEWIAGRVYDADTVPGSLTLQVFIPIAFGALKGYARKQIPRLFMFAIVGEDRTTGYAINSHPQFVSCRLWRRADAERAQAMAVSMKAAMDAVS